MEKNSQKQCKIPVEAVLGIVVLLSLAAFFLLGQLGIKLPAGLMGFWLLAVIACSLSLLLKLTNKIRAREEEDEKEAELLFRKKE